MNPKKDEYQIMFGSQLEINIIQFFKSKFLVGSILSNIPAKGSNITDKSRVT
jgi:hypothetical protein